MSFFSQIIAKTHVFEWFFPNFFKRAKKGPNLELGAKYFFQGQAPFESARFVKSGPQKGQMASLVCVKWSELVKHHFHRESRGV